MKPRGLHHPIAQPRLAGRITAMCTNAIPGGITNSAKVILSDSIHRQEFQPVTPAMRHYRFWPLFHRSMSACG